MFSEGEKKKMITQIASENSSVIERLIEFEKAKKLKKTDYKTITFEEIISNSDQIKEAMKEIEDWDISDEELFE